MMNKYRSAMVFVQNKYAGMLEETETGYTFQYAEEYLNAEDPKAVSLTLPLRADTFSSNVLFPFFDGLIPEGWLLHIVKKNWKLNDQDRFGLLLAACKDCIGDVSIREVFNE